LLVIERGFVPLANLYSTGLSLRLCSPVADVNLSDYSEMPLNILDEESDVFQIVRGLRELRNKERKEDERGNEES
jgi:hypothetical protein